MNIDERELEKFGEKFIASFEAIRRALNLYPASHPNVAAHLERFMANLEELRTTTGESTVNLANGEFFVNGAPLKRLSLNYQTAIAAWEGKGIGLIAFREDMTAESLLKFFEAVAKDDDEIAAQGGLGELLTSVGVEGIQTASVTIGVGTDEVSKVDAELPMIDAEEPDDIDVETAQQRYKETYDALLTAIQGAAAVDPRVRMVRNLSQIVESRLLERRVVRDLASDLRRHDKESYRHALGGAVIAVLMGSALGVNARRLRLLGEAALLRDIGKLQINPDVLHARDRNEATQKEYRRHASLGAKLLLPRAGIDPTAAIVAYEHHAQLDLKGFPQLRARASVHAFSRIVAVACDYERVTGGYPGVEVMTVWEAVSLIVRGVGSLYDPSAVRSFLRVMGCIPEGTPLKLLDGREGIVAGPGKKTWLAPEVAILRDADGDECPPDIVDTDGVAPAGESVVHSFLFVSEHDRQRLEILRNLE